MHSMTKDKAQKKGFWALGVRVQGLKCLRFAEFRASDPHASERLRLFSFFRKWARSPNASTQKSVGCVE